MTTPTIFKAARTTPRYSKMEPIRWVTADSGSVLDIGCNAGELLASLAALYPHLRLAGCDVNPAALDKARQLVPQADIRESGAATLPFADESFDCVTCIEVLEHVPPSQWRASLAEMRRVLAPGGRLILRTPHAGLFAWLDTNNLRYRFPRLYRFLLGKGRRDDGFGGNSEAVEWHYHFTRDELIDLAGAGWRVSATRYGGLIVFPLGDYVRWPFYRIRRSGHPVERFVTRVMSKDYGVSFGRASYGILMVLEKV
jgi:SAM-dependent methyltransferase